MSFTCKWYIHLHVNDMVNYTSVCMSVYIISKGASWYLLIGATEVVATNVARLRARRCRQCLAATVGAGLHKGTQGVAGLGPGTQG